MTAKFQNERRTWRCPRSVGIHFSNCLVPRRLSLSLSLSMKMCAQRKTGRRQRARLRLPMVPCGSLPVARLYLAKNEAPEEEAVSARHHREAKRQVQNAGHKSPMQVRVQVTVLR